MKIMIYGEQWEGTLPNMLAKTLAGQEFEIFSFDHTDILPGIKVRNIWQILKRRMLSDFYSKKIRRALIERCKEGMDALLVCKGIHLDAQTLLEVKKYTKLLINWNPDDFFNMKNSNLELIASMHIYDLIVSPRPHLFSEYKAHGARDLLFIDWYYISSLHKNWGLKKDILISFVGSWSPERECSLTLINAPVHVFGGGWHNSSARFKKKHIVKPKVLSQIEMSKVFNRSRLNINILTHENRDRTNLRMFEVAASMGLLVTNDNFETRQIFGDDGCIYYSNLSSINELLEGSGELQNIAVNGWNRVYPQCDFDNRVSALKDWIAQKNYAISTDSI